MAGDEKFLMVEFCPGRRSRSRIPCCRNIIVIIFTAFNSVLEYIRPGLVLRLWALSALWCWCHDELLSAILLEATN